MLHGGHVVMDNPELYELETCPDKAEPLSSRLGMAGPPVRQSLHGRTAQALGAEAQDGSEAPLGPGDGMEVIKQLADPLLAVAKSVSQSTP